MSTTATPEAILTKKYLEIVGEYYDSKGTLEISYPGQSTEEDDAKREATVLTAIRSVLDELREHNTQKVNSGSYWCCPNISKLSNYRSAFKACANGQFTQWYSDRNQEALVDVAQFRQLGMTGLSLHDIIDMKIQGVTPDYARHVRETWKDASAHDLIDMRIQGVDPSDVAQFRQLGITDMSLHTLIEMRIQGVTPDYVRQMKDAGFSGSAHEFVNAKIQDITPEFVRTVRSHGFTNLSAHKLIQLKLAGIF